MFTLSQATGERGDVTLTRGRDCLHDTTRALQQRQRRLTTPKVLILSLLSFKNNNLYYILAMLFLKYL